MKRKLTVALALAADGRSDMARFIESLGRHENVMPTSIDTTAISSSSADFVIAALGFRPEAAIATLPSALLPRLIPLGVDRSVVAELVRRFDLAAVIEYDFWRAWAWGSDAPGVLLGKRTLAAHYAIFADISDQKYVFFIKDGMDLPALIADYLTRLRDLPPTGR